MTDYPAYRNGLTIEVRDGRYCVTNDFGGKIVNTCMGLDDALEMRERAVIGYSAEAVQLARELDATKNRIHDAKVAIEALAGEPPYRRYDGWAGLVTYQVWNGVQFVYGDAYPVEGPADAIALERLLTNLQALSPVSLDKPEYQAEVA